MKLSEIHPYENNPRMNEGAVDVVAESIRQYGFNVPIVIDKDREIIAGHTRYKAALKLNIKEVPCIIAGNLNKMQAKAYRIADNKTSDFSIWDNKLLIEELKGLDDLFTGFDLEGIFDADVLNENENSAIEENEYGVAYEAVFRSMDKSKIEQIKLLWEEMGGDD